MTLARALGGLLLLVPAAGIACDDNCERQCMEDFYECQSYDLSDRCDSERDQCIATCDAQPDFGDLEWNDGG